MVQCIWDPWSLNVFELSWHALLLYYNRGDLKGFYKGELQLATYMTGKSQLKDDVSFMHIVSLQNWISHVMMQVLWPFKSPIPKEWLLFSSSRQLSGTATEWQTLKCTHTTHGTLIVATTQCHTAVKSHCNEWALKQDCSHVCLTVTIVCYCGRGLHLDYGNYVNATKVHETLIWDAIPCRQENEHICLHYV